MTVVEGQIESLKRLKETLKGNGITRFSSLGDMDRFVKNYEAERRQLPDLIEGALETELQGMHAALARQEQIYQEVQATVGNELGQVALTLEAEIAKARNKSKRNPIYRVIYFPVIKYWSLRKSNLEKNFHAVLNRKAEDAASNVAKQKRQIDEVSRNRSSIISRRCMKSLRELDHTKAVIDGLQTLVAGAIGENAVVKTLQQLSDEFYLFNDLSLEFDPPIYNRNENDRIVSIQIDHLLVCRAGVFLLETKNWSRKSLDNLDLRSPVKQILRSSFALFVLLNRDSEFGDIDLEQHHWGSKRIPIRNVVVMINEKPNVEFRHVKVVSLAELNAYIQYFDQVFSAKEVQSLVRYLKARKRMGE